MSGFNSVLENYSIRIVQIDYHFFEAFHHFKNTAAEIFPIKMDGENKPKKTSEMEVAPSYKLLILLALLTLLKMVMSKQSASSTSKVTDCGQKCIKVEIDW